MPKGTASHHMGFMQRCVEASNIRSVFPLQLRDKEAYRRQRVARDLCTKANLLSFLACVVQIYTDRRSNGDRKAERGKLHIYFLLVPNVS